MTTQITGKSPVTGSFDEVYVTNNGFHINQYVWDTATLNWIKQSSSGSGTGTDVNITNSSIPVSQNGAWSVGVTGSVAVTGPLTDTQLRAASVVVDPQGNANTSVNSVAASASSVTLQAANASRKGLFVYNDSSSVLYLKLGPTASSSSFTVKMVADSYYEVPATYTGIVDGLWVSAVGSAKVTEVT